MSKRFYYDEFCEEIFDEEIQTYPSNQSICGILNKQAERIAELEEQLKNAKKETANKVIKRVEELSVFDFQAYEEMGFRRYIISEMALDNILKEYGENDVKN